MSRHCSDGESGPRLRQPHVRQHPLLPVKLFDVLPGKHGRNAFDQNHLVAIGSVRQTGQRFPPEKHLDLDLCIFTAYYYYTKYIDGKLLDFRSIFFKYEKQESNLILSSLFSFQIQELNIRPG